VCVLDSGRLVEAGPPLELFDRGAADGAFRRMADSSNIGRREIEEAQAKRQQLRAAHRPPPASTLP
jgi:hypothetical protein